MSKENNKEEEQPTESPEAESQTANESMSPADEAGALQAEVAKLKHELLLQRADFENTRKRLEREKQDYVKYASLPLLRDMVEAIDNFELALNHAPEDDPMRKGVVMALEGVLKAFAKYNITKTGAKGEKFNPSLHEAFSVVSDPSKPDNTVVEVARPGYLLYDRLVRPASVLVNRTAQSDDH